MTVSLDTPLTQFPGVGAVRAGKLSKLGLEKAGDLLLRYPRDYEDPAADVLHPPGPSGNTGVHLRHGGGTPPSLPHPEGAGAGTA